MLQIYDSYGRFWIHVYCNNRDDLALSHGSDQGKQSDINNQKMWKMEATEF